MKIPGKIVLSIIIVCYAMFICNAQDVQWNESGTKQPDIFEAEDVVELTIITDIYELKRDIGENRGYHDALLIYKDFDTVDVVTRIEVKTRGRIRRSRDICNFPPLKIRMERNDALGTIFSGNEELKVVTHCQTRKEFYEQYIILEYLIYKMYQVIAEEAFRVRLAKITYQDYNSNVDDIVKFAIILEDDEILARRLNGSILEVKNIHPNYTALTRTNRLALFQYMIANTDWSYKALHNIKLLFVANSAPIAIPYDFDYAGLINTNYAVPGKDVNISSVRQRYYNGYCTTPERLKENLNLFSEKKEAITAIIQDSPYLDDKYKEGNVAFILEFFEIIEDKKKIEQIFINNCRTD